MSAHRLIRKEPGNSRGSGSKHLDLASEDLKTANTMRTPSSRKLGQILPVVALAACILWVHTESVSGSARLTAHHDNLDGAAPLRVEAARQWHSGHWPLWNPYKRTGMPLLADTTAGAMYPGNLPFLWMAGPAGAAAPPVTAPAHSAVFRAMDQVAALHAVLAGLFMLVFLRAIGIAMAPSVLGALVYACSGTMGWFAAWYVQIQNSAIWLPLILAAVHRVATGSADPARWIAAGALAVALQWLAGFPETSFYSGLIAIGYAASLLGNRRAWRPLLAVAAIYTAGIALAAVQLLPALELQSLSRRPESLTLEMFQSLPASVSMMWHWLIPSTTSGFEFPPAAAYHFGAAAVAAAVAGLIAAMTGRSRAAMFFAVMLVLGFLLSIGAATPLSEWAWHVPGLGAFRHPFKHMFELSLAVAGLSAIGADRIVRWRPQSRWPLAVVVAAIAFTCISLRINQRALVSGNAAGVDISGRAPQLLRHLEPGWRVLTPRQVFQKRDPEFLLGDYPTQFEVPAMHGAGPFLWSALAGATGMIEEEMLFRRGLFARGDRTLALLSCRYLVQTRRGAAFAPALDAALYQPLFETSDFRLMQRGDALPRFRFVAGVGCGNRQAIAESLHGGTPDPRDTALLDCNAADAPQSSLLDPSRLAVEVSAERPGRIELSTRVPVDGRGFLVIGQADFPGWHARTDGAASPVRRVHGLVQGIELAAGTSRVELHYAPRSFAIGAALSTATLAVLLLLVVAGQRRRSGAIAHERPATDQSR